MSISIYIILPRRQRMKCLILRSFLLVEQCPGPPFLDVTKFRGSYAWNYRELATLLNLKGRFEPLKIGPMGKNLTTELS